MILEVVQLWDPGQIHQNLNHHNFNTLEAGLYPPARRQEVMDVLCEGWAWLKRECLFIPRPGSFDNVILSRKAKQLTSRAQLEAYRRANLLAGMLHPSIEREAKAAFMRGDYETAIFVAFKKVEIAVRDAGGFTATDLGVALMNEAFQVKVGPLTNKTLPEPEQLALRNLFSGAIGYYKNPGSHRHFPTDPNEVAEALFFASMLLRIVYARQHPKVLRHRKVARLSSSEADRNGQQSCRNDDDRFGNLPLQKNPRWCLRLPLLLPRSGRCGSNQPENVE